MTTKIAAAFLILLFAFASHVYSEEQPIRVAVFQGKGVGPSSEDLIETLKQDSQTKFEISRITTAEILEGKLEKIDVIVHPGGSGGGQGRALGEKGRERVREFIKTGGGFLGVCGGAYLATNDYTWSLNLIDAKVVDRRHWARGKGEVELQLSPEGAKFFGEADTKLTIYYGQGPLLSRREWDDPAVPDYESLAIYATEIARNGAPKGVMARTSAAVRTDYGNGRVFCYSPHPELTEGLGHLIPLAVKWVAGKKESPAE